MELLHIQYRKNKTTRYLLLLYLGQKPNKICGVTTESINDKEKEKIISNKNILSTLAIDKQLEWLKKNCPNAYSKGYREINTSNFTIIERHNV